MVAKKKELVLRNAIDSETWDSTFQGIQLGEFSFTDSNVTEQLIKKHFEDMTGKPASECSLTKNFSRWAKAVQSFWFTQCGEDASKIKNKMGELPRFEIKPAVKAKTGDIRNMVLPGGGDLTTRVWASMRVKVYSLAK